MVWKILSGITAACLAAAAYFAWVNSQQVTAEKMLSERANTNLAQLMERKQQGEESKSRKEAKVAQLEKDRDQTKLDVTSATAEAQEKEASLALLKTNLDQLAQQVTTLKKKIEDAGDIKKLIAQVDALKTEQVAAEGALANREQQLASAQGRVTSLLEQKRKLEETQERIRRGVVEPDFQARVSGVFPQWGFVVLNKGNSQGAFANAILNVKRGEDIVAKIRVKNVEPSISVADLVEGSLSEGVVIRSGDLVVPDQDELAKITETKTSPSPTTELPESPTEMPSTPAAEPAMGTDPFGSSPAPAMDGGAAPAMADPFGAAPAPAPASEAPMAADPFGN